ncbi:MAG: hypothetical protein ACK5KL_05175 [Dysgonomonas sp.]
MFEDLKFLARRNYQRGVIGTQKNYVRLIINRPEKRTLLIFHKKPSQQIRRYLRSLNYKWSRKHQYWHSHLSRDKSKQIKIMYNSFK